MYSVVKKDGRIIEFDISKICEAVSKVLEAMDAIYEEIDAVVKETADIFGHALHTFAHSLAHWLLHTLYSTTYRIEEATGYDQYSTGCLAMVVRIQVKTLTLSFLEHAHVCRAAWLLRIQDRGVEGNSDSDYMHFAKAI